VTSTGLEQSRVDKFKRALLLEVDMKNAWFAMVAAMVLMLGVVPAYGQMDVTSTLKLGISFSFNVGDKTLPAGEYLFAPLNDKTIKIQNVDGHHSVVVMTSSMISGSGSQRPKLVFHRYGDRYFLSQAWLRYSDAGRELFVSAQELEMARTQTQSKVIVAGN
jgi:hypothetical protein